VSVYELSTANGLGPQLRCSSTGKCTASAGPAWEPYCATEGFPKPAKRIQRRCTQFCMLSGVNGPSGAKAGMKVAGLSKPEKAVYPVRRDSSPKRVRSSGINQGTQLVHSRRRPRAADYFGGYRRVETGPLRHRPRRTWPVHKPLSHRRGRSAGQAGAPPATETQENGNSSMKTLTPILRMVELVFAPGGAADFSAALQCRVGH
jgi:hypothetical protein